MSWHSRHPRRPSHGRPAGARWSRAPEPPPRERLRPAAPSLGPAPADRPILIVDDDAFGRETLGQILAAGGYRVQQAATGDEALRALRGQSRAGLIVLDLLMPRLSGWEFVRRKEADPGLAGIPVIVVSAEYGAGLGDEFTAVVAHFQKPIPVRELLAAIRRHLPL